MHTGYTTFVTELKIKFDIFTCNYTSVFLASWQHA